MPSLGSKTTKQKSMSDNEVTILKVVSEVMRQVNISTSKHNIETPLTKISQLLISSLEKIQVTQKQKQKFSKIVNDLNNISKKMIEKDKADLNLIGIKENDELDIQVRSDVYKKSTEALLTEYQKIVIVAGRRKP